MAKIDLKYGKNLPEMANNGPNNDKKMTKPKMAK
jgi:hypothetical protein